MGSGASAPVAPAENSSSKLEYLQQENARLLSHIQQLEARLGASSPSSQDASSYESSLEDNVAGNARTGRREEISAEVRQMEIITSNYVKPTGTPKSKETISILSQAVEQSLLFNSLGRADKADCVSAFTKEEHGAGYEVISQGDRGDAFYVITGGELAVMVKSQTGSTDRKGVLKAGHSFGELALLYNKARAATIVTRTPVVIWSLSRDTFVTISAFYKSQRTNQSVKYLKKIGAFAALGRGKLASVAEAMDHETHRAGETIILQGERGQHFYLIKEGKVRYEKTSEAPNGDTSAEIIGEDGPGGCFGERALLDDNDKRTASVVAATNVHLLSMDRSIFRQLIKGRERELLAMRKESLIREATKVGERFRKTIHLSDLDILRTLGEGAFGRVRLVKHKETDVMYALKYLAKKNIVDNASQEHVSNEKTIMMMIDNAFVLKLYNSFQDKRYLYFLVELVRGGELFTLLRDEGSLHDKSARFYAAGVIEAFKSMHALCITYRDLKPENLLITRDGYIKLIDLGLAKVVTERTWTLCGTPEYIAPEVLLVLAALHSLYSFVRTHTKPFSLYSSFPFSVHTPTLVTVCAEHATAR